MLSSLPFTPPLPLPIYLAVFFFAVLFSFVLKCTIAANDHEKSYRKGCASVSANNVWLHRKILHIWKTIACIYDQPMLKLKSKVYLLVFEAHATSHENDMIFDEFMGLGRFLKYYMDRRMLNS